MCDQYARSTGTPWWCWRSLSFVPTSLYAWESPRDSTALRKSVTCWYASSRTGRRTKGQRYHADSRSRFADVSDARRTSCADGALLRPTAVFQNTSARPTAWSTPAQKIEGAAQGDVVVPGVAQLLGAPDELVHAVRGQIGYLCQIC